jgi:hypothetical protein
MAPPRARPLHLLHLLAFWIAGTVHRPVPAAAQQLPNQAFEVVPDPARATVGDPVTLRFRVRLDQLDLLYDTTPQPLSALGDSVRLLGIERLHREPDRSFAGRAVVAFYRTGRQQAPVFGLPYMRGVKGMTRGMLTSDTATVEIVPVLPAGNPAPRDIRDIVRQRAHDWQPVAAALALLAALIAGALGVRRRRHTERAPAGTVASAAAAPSPYDAALARLAEIERAGPLGRGGIDLYYAAVLDALRAYLEQAHGVAALTATGSELRGALLPPPVADGAGWEALIDEADLVKFARLRPDVAAAERFATRARAFLEAWHAGAGGARPPVPAGA